MSEASGPEIEVKLRVADAAQAPAQVAVLEAISARPRFLENHPGFLDAESELGPE
jgi:hypothetical protein